MRNPAIWLMIRFGIILVLTFAALAAFYLLTEIGGLYLVPIPFLVAAYDGGLRLYAHNGRHTSSLEAWCLVFAFVAVTCILVGGALLGVVLAYPGIETPTITGELAAYLGGGSFLTVILARLLILAASRHADSVII